MNRNREIIRLHNQGISKSSIARSCECSRNTVASIISRAEDAGLSWPLPSDFSDGKLQTLLFPNSSLPTSRKTPDYDYVHKEMAKSGVTLSLLWSEYCEACRRSGEIPFMYTQYCKYYREYANTTKATMHIDRKPGEQLEVDRAGQTATLSGADTGEAIPVCIFVAVLSCSGYAYVEGFLSQNQECWIAAHVNAYRFFGGATRILVPDNLKTGVERANWYTPVINKAYHELAEHYGTAVIPARVRKPKDKPHAEGSVKTVTTWILAALRHQQFFSLAELNAAIHEKLEELNQRPFQKKPGSRWSTFLAEEKASLIPLPRAPFELALWRIATVQHNYHVAVEKMYYSVPYEYIKHKVDVRLTRKVVEIFFNGHRLCSHPRLRGSEGQYSTVVEHMPPDHQRYVAWDKQRFLTWAQGVGPNTVVAVKAIFAAYRVERQGYRSCMALLKLGDKHSVARLEAACAKALTYTPNPSLKSIQTILQTGQDKIRQEQPVTQGNDCGEFGFVRGADYYGRNSK